MFEDEASLESWEFLRVVAPLCRRWSFQWLITKSRWFHATEPTILGTSNCAHTLDKIGSFFALVFLVLKNFLFTTALLCFFSLMPKLWRCNGDALRLWWYFLTKSGTWGPKFGLGGATQRVCESFVSLSWQLCCSHGVPQFVWEKANLSPSFPTSFFFFVV